MSLKASIVCLSTSRVSLGSLGQLRASTQSSRSCVATVIWVAWLAQVSPSWNPVKSAGGQPPMTRAAVKHPPGYAVIPNRPDTTVNASAGSHRTVTSLPRRNQPRRRRRRRPDRDQRRPMLVILLALLRTAFLDLTKGSNCKSLNVAHKDRCVVCKKPGDNYVRRKYGRRCVLPLAGLVVCPSRP